LGGARKIGGKGEKVGGVVRGSKKSKESGGSHRKKMIESGLPEEAYVEQNHNGAIRVGGGMSSKKELT